MTLDPTLNALQDLAHGEMIGELRQQVQAEEARLRPMMAPANAADQARAGRVDGIQRPGEGAAFILASPHDVSRALDGVELHHGHGADRNRVADLESLPLRENALRAARAAGATDVLEQIKAIETCTPVAHLQQPRPDLFGSPLDGDGARGEEGWPGIQVIAGHGALHFLVGGTPTELKWSR